MLQGKNAIQAKLIQTALGSYNLRCPKVHLYNNDKTAHLDSMKKMYSKYHLGA